MVIDVENGKRFTDFPEAEEINDTDLLLLRDSLGVKKVEVGDFYSNHMDIIHAYEELNLGDYRFDTTCKHRRIYGTADKIKIGTTLISTGLEVRASDHVIIDIYAPETGDVTDLIIRGYGSFDGVIFWYEGAQNPRAAVPLQFSILTQGEYSTKMMTF